VFFADVLVTKEIVFDNIVLLTDENQIQQWWLKQYKEYMEQTSFFYRKYKFVPPPPPLPPANLKDSN
jgi:hypothetical protein